MQANTEPLTLLNECDEDVATAMRQAAERAEAMRERESMMDHGRPTSSAATARQHVQGAKAIDPMQDPASIAASFRRERDVSLLQSAAERAAMRRDPLDLWIAKQFLHPGEMRKTLARWYYRVRSFGLAHVWGFADDESLARRNSACSTCTFRVTESVGRGRQSEYCQAENGGRGCGCPKHWAWVPGTLAYKRRLRNFRCPIGKFGSPVGWYRLTWLMLYAVVLASIAGVIFG